MLYGLFNSLTLINPHLFLFYYIFGLSSIFSRWLLSKGCHHFSSMKRAFRYTRVFAQSCLSEMSLESLRFISVRFPNWFFEMMKELEGKGKWSVHIRNLFAVIVNANHRLFMDIFECAHIVSKRNSALELIYELKKWWRNSILPHESSGLVRTISLSIVQFIIWMVETVYRNLYARAASDQTGETILICPQPYIHIFKENKYVSVVCYGFLHAFKERLIRFSHLLQFIFIPPGHHFLCTMNLIYYDNFSPSKSRSVEIYCHKNDNEYFFLFVSQIGVLNPCAGR